MALVVEEEAVVTQRFNAVKRQHIDAALDAELIKGTDYRVYTVELRGPSVTA